MKYKKSKRKILNFALSFCILIFALYILANEADAAILYLNPSSGSYNLDDVFIVEIRLDTQGETINAAEVNLGFDNDVLEFKDFSKGNSVLNLWVKEPTFSVVSCGEANVLCGLVSFSGGIPGGYWGKDGLLVRIVLQAKPERETEAKLEFLKGSKALLNDGKGTEANLSFKEAVLSVGVELQQTKNEWREEIEKDNILPESFKIEISQNPAIFEGKYFITFSTTDKETGIDHYEVLEAEQRGLLRRLTQKKEEWKVGDSPHILENQKLTSDISVKAIDKAGNFWMETLEAPNKPEEKWEIYIGLGIILILGIIIWRIKRKTKNENQ